MQIPVSAKNANGMSADPNSAGIAMISENTDTAITALNGTLSLFTRRNKNQPGIARSRENAYQVREALVSLQNDRAFLTRGDVFSDDQIDSYIELKWDEVMRWETTPSPVEFDMYYSS